TARARRGPRPSVRRATGRNPRPHPVANRGLALPDVPPGRPASIVGPRGCDSGRCRVSPLPALPLTFVRPAPPDHMLSILRPGYNERERVERAIAEVLDTPLPTQFELIVVDDGSTDGTSEILRRVVSEIQPPHRVRLFEHEHNQGKGAAGRP